MTADQPTTITITPTSGRGITEVDITEEDVERRELLIVGKEEA